MAGLTLLEFKAPAGVRAQSHGGTHGGGRLRAPRGGKTLAGPGEAEGGAESKVSMLPTGQSVSQLSTCSVMCGLPSHSLFTHQMP